MLYSDFDLKIMYSDSSSKKFNTCLSSSSLSNKVFPLDWNILHKTCAKYSNQALKVSRSF